MNKLKNLLPLLIMAVVMISCSDDSDDATGTVNVNLKAYWGNDPVVLNEEVWYFNDEVMTISKLNLFLSELMFSTTDEDVMVSEVEFIDFDLSNRTEGGAAEGITRSFEVPVGTYDSFDFGIGLSEDLNSKLPSEYPSDHVLGQFGSYWTAWNSFIFSKTEGMIDSDGDEKTDLPFVYHVGSDVMYRTVSAPGPIEVASGDDMSINIVIDYKRVFGVTMDHIDILTYPAFHSPQDSTLTELTQRLADNFKEAFVVEMK